MRMSLRIFTIFVALVLSVVLFSLRFNMSRFHYSFTEAAYRTILFAIEDTVWQTGFSESQFSKLYIGMDEQEVYSLLGNPLRKTCDNTNCEWIYTWQRTSNSSFDRREVIFNIEGRVTKIRHEFFIGNPQLLDLSYSTIPNSSSETAFL